MDKNLLREQALYHLDHFDVALEEAEATAELFLNAVPLTQGQIVGAYWPIKKEFDVRYIIDAAQKAAAVIALPVARRDTREMMFSKWDGQSNLIRGEFNAFIPAELDPVEPEIVLVPMLAFDRRGYRLGRGGGHYDATLAALRQKRDILAVGVAYAAQAVLFNLPLEDHDQRLDMIITPQGVTDFRL